MQVVLLCAIANGDTSMVCTPNALADSAKCFTGLSLQQMDAISVMLLCEISTNGGGGGGGAPDHINYAGPPITNPPNLAYIVVDINDQQWMFSQTNNAWQ
jgi:hypothetical protein